MKKLYPLFFFIALAMMGCKESSLDLSPPTPNLDQIDQTLQGLSV